MPVDIWVENHSPVPLTPLKELGLSRGSVVFLGKRVVRRPDRSPELTETNEKAEPDTEVFEGPEAPGWVVYAGRHGFRSADDPADCWMDDTLDRDQSLGRLLQPGEALCVRYTSG